MDAAHLTLREFYTSRVLVLFHDEASSSTLREYQFSLDKWEGLSANRPLADVDQVQVSEFRAKLRKKVSPATANKHCRHLNFIFSKAGPAGPGHRDSLGIIDRHLWLRQSTLQLPLPTFMSGADVAAVYAGIGEGVAAISGRSLGGLEVVARAQWESLICCAYNLGYRRDTLLSTPAANVDLKSRTFRPLDAGTATKRRNEKPLNQACVEHLLRSRHGGELLFAIAGSQATWYRTWWAINAAAGFAKPGNFRFHDLKRACGCALAKVGASTWAVDYMLDHSSRGVTGRYYVNPLDELRDVVELIPQPWNEGLAQESEG